MIRSGIAAFAAASVLAACGGTTSPELVPQLPSEGDAHVAKPGKPGDRDVGDPWAGRSDLITAPAAQEPSALKLPEIERFTLRNGLKVLVVEDDSLPVVAMRLGIRAGRQNEARETVGLADFAAAMLDKGARSLSASRIAEEIDTAGGALSASADYDGTYVSCQVLSKDLGTCLKLLPQVVSRPTFPKAEMPTVRENLLAEVRQRRDDAGQLASAHFRNALWGAEHPRGWVMSARSVSAIERADLVKWHDSYFVPNNATLVIAGDVDAADLKKKLSRSFRTWRRGKVTQPPAAKPQPVDGYRIRLVNKPDQTQSHIRVGHYGLKLDSPDFYDALIFNYALGGGAFSSRLMKVVRSEAGKTYGASSTFNKDRTRGALWITTFTRTAETGATITLLLRELAKMASQGPTEKEVQDAIANIAGSYSTSFQSADAFASALLGAEMAGFDEDYVRDYALEVGKVDEGSASRSAAKRLDPDNLVIVIVGNASEVGPQLESAGWKFDTVDFMAPVADYERKQVAEEKAPASEEDHEKAAGILDSALAKKGGNKLSKVKNLKLEASATISIQNQKLPVKMSRVMVRPDKLQLVMKVMGSEQVVTVNGQSGWVKQSMQGKSQVIDIPAKDMRAARSQMWRDQELILLRHKEEGTSAKLLDSKGAHHVIELTRGTWAVRLFINKKTRLLDKMVYQEAGEVATEEYSDYKPVNGILVAHRRKTTQKMMGRPAAFDIVLDKVSFDTKVDPARFKKPSK